MEKRGIGLKKLKKVGRSFQAVIRRLRGGGANFADLDERSADYAMSECRPERSGILEMIVFRCKKI
jgi:hypothetical protein